jgi:hypothetical protein
MLRMRLCGRGFLAFWLGLVKVHAADFETARLAGNVTTDTGKAIAGATVWVNRTTGAKMDRESMLLRASTDEAGHYELALRFANGQIPIVREVFAEKRGFVRGGPPVEIPLHPNETAKLSFSLKPGQVLSGFARLPLLEHERNAKPETVRRFIQVSGPNLAGLVENALVFQTEPGGHFEFYLPPGDYTLRAIGYGSGGAEWKGISSGRENIVLELPTFAWSAPEVEKAFDGFWREMDQKYSYFVLKKDVDWAALRNQYRPKAIQTKNAGELALVLQEMLAPLRDLHIWMETPAGEIPSYRSGYNYNGNLGVTLAQLTGRKECGRFATVAKTKAEGFGYFLLLNQGAANPANVKQAVEAIRNLYNAPGFIVDLRSANGGSEPFALEIAKLFCAKESISALSKYRNGGRHDAFTKEYNRILPAVADPFTRPVVCLIGPGAVSSGEGFVQMMKCLPQVTTVGLATRGASGNPQAYEMPQTGIKVYFSRWVDLLPDGHTFEGVGIRPAIEVSEPSTAYSTKDPTLEKGLEVLREKVATAKSADAANSVSEKK